jgi:heme/copper-type cytochrome/quinol oxidase subunit 1
VTLALGRPRAHPSLGFIAGDIALHGLALLNAGIAAVVGVQGGAWATGYQHAGFLLPPLLLAAAGLWHWAPKIWGGKLRAGAGWLCALSLMGGGVLQSGASFLAGYQGAANRTIDAGNVALSRLAGLGAVVTIVGFLILILEVSRAAFGKPDRDLEDDPWGESQGLEWTIPSPPPVRNFESLPGAVTEPEPEVAVVDSADQTADPEPVGAPA